MIKEWTFDSTYLEEKHYRWNKSFRKVNVMKVLSEMPTGMGSKWILAKFSNDFYGYGTEMDFKSAWGLPVNQCGTKTEVLENCLRMQKVNLDFIDKYNKELLKEKKKPDGCKKLIEHEKIEYEMHLKFANILTESDWEVEIWISSRGQNGVPSSISALVHDAEWKLEQLESLLSDLQRRKILDSL